MPAHPLHAVTISGTGIALWSVVLTIGIFLQHVVPETDACCFAMLKGVQCLGGQVDVGSISYRMLLCIVL